MSETNQLIQELSTQASRIRPVRPHVYACYFILALLAYTLGIGWWLGMRPDLALQLQRPLYLIELCMLLAMLTSAATISAYAMLPDMAQKKYMLTLPYLFSGLMLGVVVWQFFAPPDTRMALPEHPEHTVECALFIALSSLLPAMLIFSVLRKGATLMPGTAGGLAMITSCAIGALTLRLAEPDDHSMHLLIWHYIPSVSFAAIGTFLGRIVLRW